MIANTPDASKNSFMSRGYSANSRGNISQKSVKRSISRSSIIKTKPLKAARS